MSRSKPKDLSGTAYCGECGAEAKHESGIGSPLSIKHRRWCSEERWTPRIDPELERSARRLKIELPKSKPIEPVVRVLRLIEEATWGDPRFIEEATVTNLASVLGLSPNQVRRAIVWLKDGKFIEPFEARTGRSRFAYRTVRKDSE